MYMTNQRWLGFGKLPNLGEGGLYNETSLFFDNANKIPNIPGSEALSLFFFFSIFFS